MQITIIIFCGIIIGLAIYLLIRSLIKMSKGRCCEGCSGCPQAQNCSSIPDSEKHAQDGKEHTYGNK